jgi:hypothetical protein
MNVEVGSVPVGARVRDRFCDCSWKVLAQPEYGTSVVLLSRCPRHGALENKCSFDVSSKMVVRYDPLAVALEERFA